MTDRPTPQLHKHVVTKEDGRTLILYHFTTEAEPKPASKEGETP